MQRILILVLMLALLGCAAIIGQSTLPPVTDIQNYGSASYPMQVKGFRVTIYSNHSDQSSVLGKIPRKAIVEALGEAGSQGEVAYYKIRTKTGMVGWCKRWDVKTITTNEAELAILRDKQFFEQKLQNIVLSSVAKQIRNQRIHPASDIESIWINQDIKKIGSSSDFEIPVTCIMKGSILGFEKFQVNLNVSIFIHLNRDHLSSSVIETNRVTIVSDQRVQEIPHKEKFELLELLLRLLL